MNPLDELPCAVLVTDRDGQVLAANQALLRLLGGDAVLRPGSLIDDLLPPAGRIFLQTHVWPMLLRDSEVHEIHLQLLDAQRQRVPVLLNARLGTHATQDACYWTLFVARERHRFEAELVQARERAEASAVALGDSQRFVTAITDAIPGLVAYWDRDLRCRFANQAFADWFGIGPAEMVGLRLPQLLGATSFEVEARPVAAVLAGQEQRFERALTLANGRRCQVLAHYIPDLVDGQVNGFYASVADITRQHEASAALRTEMAARERVHGLLQASSAALQEAQRLGQIGNWHWQPSTGDIHWSPQLYQIMGHDPALPPLPLREQHGFYRPASHRAVRLAVAKALREGAPFELELAYQRADGGTGWVEARGAVVRRADGTLDSLHGTVQEITARRTQQQALLAAQERLRNLIDSTDAGTWEWHVPSGEVIVNERWAAILGWTTEALGPVSNDFRARIAHPDELPTTRKVLRAHFEGQTEAYVSEVRLRHREGHWIWVEDRGRVVSRTAEGRPEWVFGIHIDITERKRQEAALRRSEQLLNRTGEVAGVGGWELDLASDTLVWSAQTRRLHGVADDFSPTLAKAIAFYAPAARPALQRAVARAIDSGHGWDLELPLQQASGQTIQVRSVGHAEFEGGRAVRLIGAFQDVSEAAAHRRALQAAHQRMALATDSGGIGVWALDLATQTLSIDAWIVRLYQLDPGAEADPQVLWSQRVHADDRRAVAAAVDDSVQRLRRLDTEFRVVWRDGSVHHLRMSARVVRDTQGLAQSLIGVCWDVTVMRELAAELAKEHELLHVTLQSIGDAVITTDDQGVVTWLNPVAERMTGWLCAEATGLPLTRVFQLVHEETRQPAENPVAACLTQGEVVGLAQHTRLISRDGVEYGIEDSAAPIRNPRGDLLGAVLVFHDVSEQRRLSGEMTWRATHDALTGLVNRSEFETRLHAVLRRAHDDGSAHALLYIDLDQFKLVNDACGHAVGDQLLQQVSKLLGDAVRNRDTLARLGGDEFALILEHCPIDQAQRVAQKICDRMDDFRFTHDGRRFRIGTSIGLVPVDNRWSSITAIQQAADTSCYAAKDAGRNRVHAWFDTDTAMRTRQFEMQWTTRIERALDDHGFVLFAQRITALQSAPEGVHAEVLLRMRNDDGSLALPGAFLPAAERFHLASRVDRWVLGAAVAWLAALPPQAPVALLSVNLSGQSVGDRAFHAWANELLTRVGPEVCRRLCLEITETAAVTNLGDAGAFIDRVRVQGVRVALDDFGAGASSFGYLKSLAVDFLKIDGQFVRNLVTDPLDDAAVRCFTDVARVVGVRTVAEFVDDTAVLARLQALGVDYAQGFLLHRPEPIDGLLQATPTPLHA